MALAAVNAAEPLALRRLFDGLGRGEAGRGFVEGVLALVGLGLAREAFQGTSNWLTWRTRIGIHYRLTEATVGRLHRLPLGFHRAEGVGAVMTGPAIVEQADTTTVVPPGHRARVDRVGNLVIQKAGQRARQPPRRPR